MTLAPKSSTAENVQSEESHLDEIISGSDRQIPKDMTQHPSKVASNAQWASWTETILDRLPIPYSLIVLLFTLLIIVEQILEYAILDPTFSGISLSSIGFRFTLPSLTLYMLLVMRLLKRRAVKAMVQLRPSVLVSDEKYEGLVRRMIQSSRRIEVALLIISLVIILGLFVLMEFPLPTLGALPASAASRFFVITTYVLFGWLGLLFVYTGVKHSLGLGAISRKPLSVNVFDPDNLLPFGNLSLVHSLALVGLVLILFIFLGMPTQVTSLVPLGLATPASVLALIVPIWGVHRQIDRAKEQALVRICVQLDDIHSRVYAEEGTAQDDLGLLNDRLSILVNLKKMIREGPNWPFRDTTAVARAVTAAMSPLIYFVLIETIRIYIVPLLGE
ncbi:MAG: hypothetical protein JSV37_06755 [Anaerolineaceae bacterium]|nr:MAG: hypothetical protein JSV37_06755 [Anaerolineaceae bacterium]